MKDKKIFMKKLQVNEEKEANTILENIQRIVKFNHANLESLLSFSYINESSFFCSKIYTF